MSSDKQYFLITYDVRDPRRLRRTSKTLLGYGHRIQKSVFRCRISRRQLERLRWELASILEGEDDLLIVELCARCTSKVRVRGPMRKDNLRPQELVRTQERNEHQGLQPAFGSSSDSQDPDHAGGAARGTPAGGAKSKRQQPKTHPWESDTRSFIIV
jgi:CRISPR-associated protein Cas2